MKPNVSKAVKEQELKQKSKQYHDEGRVKFQEFLRGGTPMYGLYRYVPPDRVWFLRFSILK